MKLISRGAYFSAPVTGLLSIKLLRTLHPTAQLMIMKHLFTADPAHWVLSSLDRMGKMCFDWRFTSRSNESKTALGGY